MPITAAAIGTRVVVRRVLPGETGPSGGPAMGDVLGTLERLDEHVVSVRREDGTVVTFSPADLVTGKPVPPRAFTLLRVRPERLQVVASEGWPPLELEQLGGWQLRAAAGFTARANSALPLGDPGVPVRDALARVDAFYRVRGLPPLVQAVIGSSHEATLLGEGWRPRRPGDGVLVQVASVAQARRSSGRGAPVDVTLNPRPTPAWAAAYGRACGVPDDVVSRVLSGPASVALAGVGDPPTAIGRGVVVGDWLGLAAVEVHPAHRRQGLARAVVDALLAWGAERAARSAYVQVAAEADAALALWAAYGFGTHHLYRYLCPPD